MLKPYSKIAAPLSLVAGCIHLISKYTGLLHSELTITFLMLFQVQLVIMNFLQTCDVRRFNLVLILFKNSGI